MLSVTKRNRIGPALAVQEPLSGEEAIIAWKAFDESLAFPFLFTSASYCHMTTKYSIFKLMWIFIVTRIFSMLLLSFSEIIITGHSPSQITAWRRKYMYLETANASFLVIINEKNYSVGCNVNSQTKQDLSTEQQAYSLPVLCGYSAQWVGARFWGGKLLDTHGI